MEPLTSPPHPRLRPRFFFPPYGPRKRGSKASNGACSFTRFTIKTEQLSYIVFKNKMQQKEKQRVGGNKGRRSQHIPAGKKEVNIKNKKKTRE